MTAEVLYRVSWINPNISTTAKMRSYRASRSDAYRQVEKLLDAGYLAVTIEVTTVHWNGLGLRTAPDERRWRPDPNRDEYVDTRGAYPPLNGREIVGAMGKSPYLLAREHGQPIADWMLTRYARERATELSSEDGRATGGTASVP